MSALLSALLAFSLAGAEPEYDLEAPYRSPLTEVARDARLTVTEAGYAAMDALATECVLAGDGTDASIADCGGSY